MPFQRRMAMPTSSSPGASQPGMIRTYDTSGNAVSYYKLYSWDNMATSSFTPANDIAPSGWDAQKGIYTDLNEPVTTKAGTAVYPILDGNNLKNALKDIYGNTVAGESYDSNGDGIADVEGFSISSSSIPTQTGSNPNPVPMPVKWLYVLQDGTTVAAQSAGNGSVTAAKVPGANSTNKKIIGRIAFWTDDETSKVNINTASEGNFWDIPLADGRGERNFATNIPVEGEYQRIPGHPATVCLSSVFGKRFIPNVYAAPRQTTLDPFNPTDMTSLQNLFGLTPRMEWGGSAFGTQPNPLTPESSSSPAFLNYNSATGYTPPASPPALGTKANRLYSTIDELTFSPTRGANPPSLTSSLLTPADLNQAQFFITANSRAPEVTLFNTPRISIWPITWPYNKTLVQSKNVIINSQPISGNTYYTSTSPPMLMPEEKLLAFCGTVNGYQYYFQRQNAYDPSADYSTITRNQSLFNYLDNMTTQAIPGFGGNFSTKYGSDRPQILTEIFDYIRSGPDLNNVVAGKTGISQYGAESNYNFSSIGNEYLEFATSNSSVDSGGSVVPITITRNGVTTKGAGRYATINQVALVFYAADRTEPQPGLPNSGAANSSNTNQWVFINPVTGTANSMVAGQTITGSQTTKLGMLLLMNVTNTMTGYITNNPFFIAKITGGSFSAVGTQSGIGGSFNFPSSAGGQTLCDIRSNDGAYMSARDTFMGSAWTTSCPFDFSSSKIAQSKSFTKPAAYDYRCYPFYGDPISVSPQDIQFTFTGSQAVTLEIYPVDPASASHQALGTTPVQTITLDFSQLSGVYPMPIAPRYNLNAATGDNTDSPAAATTAAAAAGVTLPAWETYKGSGYYYSTNNASPNPYEISPSVSTWLDPISGSSPVAPWNGPWDMRNLQARAQVTDSAFTGSNLPGGGYFNTKDTSCTGAAVPLVCEGYNSTGTTTWCADTVISLSLNPAIGAQSPGGDLRLLSLTANVPSSWFVPHYAVNSLIGKSMPGKGAHSLSVSQNKPTCGYRAYENMFGYPTGAYSVDLTTSAWNGPTAWSGQVTDPTTAASLGLSPAAPILGDFCNGYGNFDDGAVIPKPDDTTLTFCADQMQHGYFDMPYFGADSLLSGTQPYFSPGRQLSGPIIFGCLPTGVQSGVPWRTLAFNPNPANAATHLGLQSPKDHLLLDLFWMPVAEPYAISEPLSTAGKINMNYQIEPFTYINRQTALYAAMKSDRVTVIPAAAGSVYKSPDKNCGASSTSTNVNMGGFRFPVDIAQTLKAFDTNFASGRLFVSPSEICTIFLVPKAYPHYTPSNITLPTDTASTKAWWASADTVTPGSLASSGLPVLTGANARQQPYGHLYSLLTTKSNTYRVHVRVQVLAKSIATDPTIFDENSGDTVVGEYRGAAILERYVNPNDTTLPDFAGGTGGSAFTTAGSNTLDGFYHFRIINSKVFAPQ